MRTQFRRAKEISGARIANWAY